MDASAAEYGTAANPPKTGARPRQFAKLGAMQGIVLDELLGGTWTAPDVDDEYPDEAVAEIQGLLGDLVEALSGAPAADAR